MRVPDISFYNSFIRNNEIKENKLLKYTNQLSSGKKILNPSDNPLDSAQALRLQKLIDDISTYTRNMDQVQNVLETAESTLGNIVNTAQDARVHIIQVLNIGVMDAEDANILKDYFESVRNYIIKQANISIGDSRIFSGVNAQKDPFNTQGIYQGQTLETKVPVSKGVELNTTFDGSKYLGTIKSGTWNSPQNKIGIVKALDDIIQIIDSGDIYKLHSYISDMGYNSITAPIVNSGESGTLTINYGSYTLNVNYNASTTLNDLVNSINSDPTNKYIEAFAFQDKDGIYRLGLVAKNDPSIPITVSDSSNNLLNKLGNISSILETFDKGFNGVSASRSRIGTQMAVIEDLKPQNEFLKTSFLELKSKLEDADYASVISELEKVRTAYEALLATFNQNKDLSLLNFLK
jgi:flagellar hook-associated protein 3 FlgL